MTKLVCDRCGNELTNGDDIELALTGEEAWEEAARVSGMEPRGIIPCENFLRCRGEMLLLQ